MAGQQDIVLASLAPSTPSTGSNPADIVCYSQDPTPANVVLYPVNRPIVLGSINITLIQLPAQPIAPSVTMRLYPVAPPVVVVQPNPKDMTLIPLALPTLPVKSSPTNIIGYHLDVTPQNIVMQSIAQTGTFDPVQNNITLIPLPSSGTVAPLVAIVLNSINATDLVLAQTITYYGRLKRWNNSNWAKKPLKYWTGSTWKMAKLKLWTGTSWGLIDTTGA